MNEAILIGDRFDGEVFDIQADENQYAHDGQLWTFRICKRTGRICHYTLTDRIVNGRLAFGFLRAVKSGEACK